MEDGTAVFTTKHILIQKKTILRVIHDEDEWQFLSGDNVKMKDLMIVPIITIINTDPSIKYILELPDGFVANRSDLKADWVISRYIE